MTMIDINFIQALRDKLKGGNTKSIHLNALPGRYATRLDLSNLNIIKPEFANEFLKFLFSKSCFEFNISFDSINLSKTSPEEQKRLSVLSKRLNSLNYENDDNYKEHGIKTFSFGYPLLIKPSKQDPRKIIKAPIFIWQLEIVKATNKVNTWTILRNKVRNSNGRIVDEEIHSVGLNEVLLSYLKTDETILIPQINEELLEDAIIDKTELIDECYKIIKALNPNTNEEYKNELIEKLNEPIKNIPESNSIDSSSSNLPWIYFGGIFGLFRAQKESIIGDIDKIIENYSDFQFDKLIVEQFPGTAHSAVQTDPSQQGILSTLNSKPRKIIQGPPGTGKSQTLTALITNALANNLKCLVVCEKKTALDVIKHNLEKESEQIGVLSAVIEDINKDRDEIVNSVRDRFNNLSSYNNYNTANYDFLIKNLENTVAEFNKQHRLLDKQIFHGKKWTNLVGEFLKYNRQVEQGKLKYKLDYKQFKFNETELFEIVSKIKTARKLYQDVLTLNHPLEILSDGVFTDETPRGIQLGIEDLILNQNKEFNQIRNLTELEISEYKLWLENNYKILIKLNNEIKDKLELEKKNYSERLNVYYSDCELNLKETMDLTDNCIHAYKDWLDNHYSTYYDSLIDEIENFTLFINENEVEFGEIFYKNNTFTKLFVDILSFVSKKYKKLKNNRLSITGRISNIKEKHLVIKYFEHDYELIENQKSLKPIVDNIIKLKLSAKQWYNNIGSTKENHINRLNSKEIHSHYIENSNDVSAIEEKFCAIIKKIEVDTKISISKNNSDTLVKQSAECKYILNQLQNKADFIHYYENSLSSNNLHPVYFENESEIKETESSFDLLCLYILEDYKLNSNRCNLNSHQSKIEYCNALNSELTNYNEFANYYVNCFSATNYHSGYTFKKVTLLKLEKEFERQALTVLSGKTVDITSLEPHKLKMISTIVLSLLNYVNTNDDSINASASSLNSEVIESKKLLKRKLSNRTTFCDKLLEIKNIQNELSIVQNHLKDFVQYYYWRKFLIENSELNRKVIFSIIEIEVDNWEVAFQSWYFYWLLSLNEHKDLPKNEDKINEIVQHKIDLRLAQKNNIVNDWSDKQFRAVRSAQYNGINMISLFNKRGSRGEKRNSLRKILRTDFNLFTSFYPVLLVSPSVCGSIIPLIEGLFDVVIFDEASQLRIEDTFPALLRGKIKIISGDSQQMPPSNFFQGGNAILSPTDEDTEEEINFQSENAKIKHSIDLADSESLLVYAENCNFEASFLKIHYRSQHPSLIEFSNHAFYGKRLIPMPAKHEYKPIEFIQVAGLYEDSVNLDEAKQVIDILLNKIKPLANGKYPSVGVATFNLYQRNLILEEITKARQNSAIDKKLSLYGSDFFVKNLENIQGDERDIIILSTTFGKRKDGSFRQQFGPILQQNGYKLLNVIITRAKIKMFVCTSIPEEKINEYPTLLRENKNTGRAVFYAYLAYSKAISENNTEVLNEILKLLYDNCESRQYDSEYNLGSESPFEEEVFNRLGAKIGEERIEQQYKIGGFRIDLVIKSKITLKPIIAIECDGAEYHSSNEAYAWDIFRESVIKPYGFIFFRIWSTNWWYSAERELNKLVEFIDRLDREEYERINFPQNEITLNDLFGDGNKTLN